MSSDIAGVLAAHEATTGPISGAWVCACGVASTNGSIGMSDLTRPEERRAEYRAHVAEQIAAHLRDVVLGAREDVGDVIDQRTGRHMGVESWLPAADAALAVVVGVLGGAE